MGNEPKRIHAYSLAVALSNNYFEVIIRCLELKLYNEKDEFLFDDFGRLLKIMITSKNYLIEQHPDYKHVSFLHHSSFS